MFCTIENVYKCMMVWCCGTKWKEKFFPITIIPFEVWTHAACEEFTFNNFSIEQHKFYTTIREWDRKGFSFILHHIELKNKKKCEGEDWNKVIFNIYIHALLLHSLQNFFYISKEESNMNWTVLMVYIHFLYASCIFTLFITE